ncbi:MAG: DUF58 domain-containing protein [Oscillospiraceae bacterium]
MELIVMALILAAVLAAQYFVYSRFGQRELRYTLTVRSHGSDGTNAELGEYVVEAFEDEEIEIIEEIDNAKILPLPWVRTEINCSRWLSFFGQAEVKDSAQKGLISGIFTLRGRQKCRRTWRVKCEKRGVFSIEDAAITVSDLFGLVKSARVIKMNQQIRVLPIPADMAVSGMSSDVFIGDIPVRRFVLPDPFVISGAREYTGREPMNRIHWQQSARTGSLMVYNNEFTTERRVLMILNMQRSFHGLNQMLSVPTMEALIKGAAFMLDWCCKSNTVCALAANSREKLSTEPGEGYEHTITALRQLAELKNGCGEHIDDFVSGLNYTDWTDVVFISSFIDEHCADLLRTLSENGRGVTILTTDIEETDFCEVWHIPRTKHYLPEAAE